MGRYKNRLSRFIACIILAISWHCVNAQTTDTIYYNDNWEICDKLFATYYRHGNVVYGNPTIIYSGPVKDYYLDGSIQMEGFYSENGEKSGAFRFFYPNGSIKAEGEFNSNYLTGEWKYYFSNGTLKARINHNGKEGSFTVIDLQDSLKYSHVKNGSGYFELEFYDTYSRQDYKIHGEFMNGKRNGNWKYYIITKSKKEVLLFKEIYTKGTFKKREAYSFSGSVLGTYYEPEPVVFISDFEKLIRIDRFQTDFLCFPIENKTNYEQIVIDFLFNDTQPGINTTKKSFEESFNIILKYLNSPYFIKNFNAKDKDYSGNILFNLSDSGSITDIDIKSNLSYLEQEKLFYLLHKFRNIQPIVIENVLIDANHKVYFYSVSSKEILPRRYQKAINEKFLIFTMMPHEKLIKKMRADIKLQIESFEKFQEHINSNLRWQIEQK